MSIEVTVRHIKINKGMQEYANQKAEELCEVFPRVEHVHVIIDSEKHLQVVEVVAQAKSHIRVEGTDSCEYTRASVDGAFEKVAKQLRKLRDKVQEKRKPSVS